jgi:glycosyltransferase involved in cell wall biosynthesis
VNNMELISIIMPIYNSEKYLYKSINSVLNQTYSHFELLLLNDGSTDNSYEIIKEFEKIDKRVKTFTHVNAGQSFTRNKGIELCKGEFIVFLDSDDTLDELFLEKMRSKISSTNVDIVVCEHFIKYPTSIKKIPNSLKGEYTGENSFQYVLEGKISHTCWGKIYKSTLIKNSDIVFPVGRTNEDLYTVAIWFLKAEKVFVFNEPLMTSFDREGSITNSFSSKFIDLLYILNLLENYLHDNNLFNKFGGGFTRKYQKMVIYLMNYGVRMKELDFIYDVVNASSIKLKDFDNRLLSNKELIAVVLMKINIKLYYFITRFYYNNFAKDVYIVK